MSSLAHCLAFDVSNRWVLVGVFRDGEAQPLAVRFSDEPRVGSRMLVPWIGECLSEAALGQPDWIAVTVGPGSFTGVRIGVSTARNLSQLWDIPVLGLDSLAVYCRSVMAERATGDVAVMVDGKQGRVYARHESAGAARTDIVGVTVDVPPDEFLTGVPASTPVFCDSDSIAGALMKAQQPEAQGAGRPTGIQNLPPPAVGTLYELAQKAGGPEVAGTWRELLPTYLRDDPATARFPEGLAPG